ncbi:MAG: HupE/UreJ family protein [Bacteroidetes bacterium]|nr:HupE/UreJ family protein [Bacteroidota bacterium]
MSNCNTVFEYLRQGFIHVIPLGFDHILFVICIFLLNSNIKSIIIQCSIFTVAHSLTLALSACNLILPNSNIIEPLIALTILYAAVENILNHKLNKARMVVLFFFGLIHGMGFSFAFKELDLSSSQFYLSLIFFNVGVELGQLLIVVLIYFLISKWLKDKSWYNKRIVYPISTIIACIAMNWFIIRIL